MRSSAGKKEPGATAEAKPASLCLSQLLLLCTACKASQLGEACTAGQDAPLPPVELKSFAWCRQQAGPNQPAWS